MEFLKIVAIGVLAAVSYGIVHDQVTARVCVEYFTIGHPPLIASTSRTFLGLAWGVVATWWVGLPLGFILAVAARLGARPKLAVAQLTPLILRLLATMATVALLAGLVGYVLARRGDISLPSAWIEPHARDVVAKHVVKAITGLGYTFADTSGPLVTAPKFSWPTDIIFKLWRGLVYPGATLTIAVEPTGPWTRVRLETRLQCETGQRPPPGHPQDVDFQTFVLSQTQAEASWAIASPLHHVKVRAFAESCAPLQDGDRKIDVCRQMAKAQPRNPEALRQYVIALARFYRARDAW